MAESMTLPVAETFNAAASGSAASATNRSNSGTSRSAPARSRALIAA